jgi:MscS family membrane protein
MKWKSRTVFQPGLFLMAAAALWFICGNGEVTGQTNAPVKAVRSDALGLEPSLLGSKTTLTFGLDKVSWLQLEIPEGFPLWQYCASLIYVLLAVIVSKLLNYLATLYLKSRAARTKTQFDDLLPTLLHGPIKVVSFVVLLHIGLQVLGWPQWFKDVLEKGLKIIVACSLTYVALRFVDLFLGYWRQRAARDADKLFDEQLFPIIDKGLKVFLVVVAVLFTSQNLGMDITSVVASLSIGGLALGLAAQDTLANLFGAAAVFMDKPFRIGDRIRLDSVDGTVEAIGLRSTRVRNLDGHFITIPNKTMGNAIITNITRRPNIKTEMNIGLTYDTSTEKLKRAVAILEETFNNHPMTFEVSVGFNRFADSALNIQIVHLWKSTDAKAHLAGMQELNLAIKRRFDEEGINFAFPSQTIYMKQDSEWRINGLARTVSADDSVAKTS